MKPSRRARRSPKPVQSTPDVDMVCSIRSCQDETPPRPATTTILLHDAKTGEPLLRHRCDEHTDPRHTVIARVTS